MLLATPARNIDLGFYVFKMRIDGTRPVSVYSHGVWKVQHRWVSIYILHDMVSDECEG
jgi:hypothetical protein